MLEEIKHKIKHHIPNVTEKQMQNIERFVEEAFLFNKKHKNFLSGFD